MAPFVVTVKSALPPAQAWERITDWPRHGDVVPLTTVQVETPPPNRVGTTFTARTGIGRVGFDDPMEVVTWEPPTDDARGFCRIEHRGRVMLGWAELTIEHLGAGSVTTWREDVAPPHVPGFAEPLVRAVGRSTFDRAVRKLLGE